MLSTPIYVYSSIILLFALALTALGSPQDDGSHGSDIQPQAPIIWDEYNGYFNLRPCLKGMFDKGDVANNVDCSTKSCLSDKASMESNIAMLLTQVPATCTNIRAVDIPMATSVLTGYCGDMKDGPLSNTTPASTTPKSIPAEPTQEPQPDPGTPESTTSLNGTAQRTTLLTDTRTPTNAGENPPTVTSEASLGANDDSTTKIALPSTIAPGGNPAPASPAPNPPSSKSLPIPNPAPKDEGSNKGGLIADIVVGVVVAVIASFLLWMCCCGPCSKQKRRDESRYEAATRIVGLSKGPTKGTGRRPQEDGQSPEMGISPGFDTGKPAELEALSTPIGPHELDSTPRSSTQIKPLPPPRRSGVLDEKRHVDGATFLRTPEF